MEGGTEDLKSQGDGDKDINMGKDADASPLPQKNDLIFEKPFRGSSPLLSPVTFTPIPGAAQKDKDSWIAFLGPFPWWLRFSMIKWSFFFFSLKN